MKIDLVEFDEEIAESLEERAEKVLEEAEEDGPLAGLALEEATHYRRQAEELREARPHAGQWVEIKDRPNWRDALEIQDGAARSGIAEMMVVTVECGVTGYQADLLRDGEVPAEPVDGITRSVVEGLDPEMGSFLYGRIRDEHASPFLAPPKAANSATPDGST